MASNSECLAKEYLKDTKNATEKYNILRNLDIFVLDTSIRESTVGQIRGHTVQDKWEIYNEVKKCGFKNLVVAKLSNYTTVDDIFVKELVERGEDKRGLFVFSEITRGIKNKVPDTEIIPISLKKMKDAGLWNVVFDLDLGHNTYDYNKFSLNEMFSLVKKWVVWCYDNLHDKSMIFINLRDLPDVMPIHPERVFSIVDFLAKLPANIRPMGFCIEEPMGNSLPEECGNWAKYIKKVMDYNDWDGHLLVHIHEKFGYCDATALQVLMDGATGVWASVCTEGGVIGNASSCVTLMNMIRLGNKKVLKNYNCQYLRQAAINVTKITTGKDPHPNQAIYGARALDLVFDLKREAFDMAGFFGEKSHIRISTMSTPKMIQARLNNLFGTDSQFTEERVKDMFDIILSDLKANRKGEYMSKVGLSILFHRSGGVLTEQMKTAILTTYLSSQKKNLNAEIKAIWDSRTWEQGDTNRIHTPNVDTDVHIEWTEFLIYLKWALNDYPNIKDSEELEDVAIRKGLIPAIRDY